MGAGQYQSHIPFEIRNKGNAMRRAICVGIFFLILSSQLPTVTISQSDTFITLYEFDSPSPSPWGLTFDGENFFHSTDSLGVIYKMNPDGLVLDTYSFPNTCLKGMTFHGDDLWVVNDIAIDDTVVYTPWSHSLNDSSKYGIYSILKIDAENGIISDSIRFMYPSAGIGKMDHIWGIGSYKSKLYVSYNGGYGPCTLEIDPLTKQVTEELCCAHPCGLSNINNNLWCVRMNSVTGPGNSIRELDFFYWNNDPTETGLKEKDTRYELDCYATDLTFDGENIWICDYSNKKIKKLSKPISTNVMGKSKNLPIINLEQTYPNPANPSTTIGFTLAETAHVSIDIYNTAGQKIDTLADSEFAAGKHTAVWDGAAYAAGVYFCTVRSGGRTVTRKMVLVK
jgi:hypothetical protein